MIDTTFAPFAGVSGFAAQVVVTGVQNIPTTGKQPTLIHLAQIRHRSHHPLKQNRMKANELKVGQRYKGKLLEVRIMAIVEGYVMCRHKGCMPFVESVKDFIKRDLPLITGNELEVKM